ncbi:hypothetical protein CEUSTIGMA_g11594.t1 [Chlamydomonas eustigma]|uniref:chorismate mutase n=1 Tax=Chlamydomonas eustigma TaxID=1157962 RepID=A0A250XM45_9CHLO|nr:hypothetical protein CEUSTIGMA_g11594.t1 [Chlamydomonas eustigma]|eukprot:GAX84171.1 hypothetical protein CEUSTIGMA_g11594.t1 [Chlamydomonas eustigma]
MSEMNTTPASLLESPLVVQVLIVQDAESLPATVLPPISYAPVLAHNEINLNASILRVYVKEVLPGITSPGDDNNYGSSAMLDVAVLQALSKRIHYGKFVAEAKFREKTYEYTQLIKSRNADGIMELLTDEAVEERVIARVALKAATFGQDIGSTLMSSSGGGSSGTNIFDTNHTSGLAANADSKSLKPTLKIQPDVVASVYKDWVMPLTKEVEVLYLLGRLQHTSPPL